MNKCIAGRIVLPIAVLALFGYAQNDYAQPSAGMVFINPAATYVHYGDKRAADTYDLDNRFGWQLGAEYLLTDHIGLEAVYSEYDPDISSSAVRQFIDVKDRRWHLDTLYYFSTPGKWVPYVVGGVGEGRLDYDVDPTFVATAGFDSHHDRETELHLGGGVRYFISDHISLRADLRAVYSLDESATDTVASLGVSYNFGGTKPVAAVAPPYQAPPAPTPVAPAVYEKIKLSSETLFDFDKATVRPDAKQALDDLTTKLTHYPQQIDTIKIIGHTDRIGADAYNQKLSNERATAIKNYLVDNGVDATMIQAEGRGSSEPETKPGECEGTKRSKALIACLQPDRRVEIDISIKHQINEK
jgi:OOP family OmpA-OmpF porin